MLHSSRHAIAINVAVWRCGGVAVGRGKERGGERFGQSFQPLIHQASKTGWCRVRKPAMTKIAMDALKWGSLCTRSGPENLVVPEIIITFVSDSQ